MPWQRSHASATLRGVGEDARYVVQHLQQYLKSPRKTHFRTYAVIAYLFTFQPFSTVLCSQNALIAEQCVSLDFLQGCC